MITMIGVGTVFLALVFLVIVLFVVERLVGVAGTGTSEAAAPDVGEQQRSASADDTASLEKIAVAAFCAHKRFRIQVRSPEPPSAWLMAGRMSQLRRKLG
jgi:Na+-transporting methylmalonyl-CoA/oxaloacetate decarboxylase gamma subunit